MTFRLTAQSELEERHVTSLVIDTGTRDALPWARGLVEELEEHNAWPEGSDALVVEEETGRRWMLTDGWDEITETEEKNNGKL